MEEKNKHGQVGLAALKSGMDRKTARKYLRASKLPSAMTVERVWRTTLVVAKILTHLGLPTEPSALSPARGPAQLELFDEGSGAARPAHPRPEAWRSRAPPGRAGAGFVVELDDQPEPEDDWGA